MGIVVSLLLSFAVSFAYYKLFKVHDWIEGGLLGLGLTEVVVVYIIIFLIFIFIYYYLKDKLTRKFRIIKKRKEIEKERKEKERILDEKKRNQLDPIEYEIIHSDGLTIGQIYTKLHEYCGIFKNADYNHINKILDKFVKKTCNEITKFTDKISEPFSHCKIEDAVIVLNIIADSIKEHKFRYKSDVFLFNYFDNRTFGTPLGSKNWNPRAGYRVYDTNYINCYGFVTLYRMVAQTIQLPLYSIYVPGHILITWQFDKEYFYEKLDKAFFDQAFKDWDVEKINEAMKRSPEFASKVADALEKINKSHKELREFHKPWIYWETTNPGMVDINILVNTYNIAVTEIDKPFLSPLDTEREISIYYYSRGLIYYLRDNDLDKAIKDFKISIVFDKFNVLSYAYLILTLRKSGKKDEANQYYKESKDLNRKRIDNILNNC